MGFDAGLLPVAVFAAGLLLDAEVVLAADFSGFVVLGVLSDFSDLFDFCVFDDLTSLAVEALVFVDTASAWAGIALLAGLSGVSATLTGVFSFNEVREAAPGVCSAAGLDSTSSGWPGLLSDFIETPLASWSWLSDMLNLPAIRSAFSPGCTV